MKRNVLHFILDDLSPEHTRLPARTPHIDGLAARGVRFGSAFCQFALCSPAALARLLRLGRRAVPLADRPLAPLAHLPAYPGAHRAAADRPATYFFCESSTEANLSTSRSESTRICSLEVNYIMYRNRSPAILRHVNNYAAAWMLTHARAIFGMQQELCG